MKNKEFLVTLAEIEVAFRFHFSGTGMLFRSYEQSSETDAYKGEYLSADIERVKEYAAEHNCSLEFAEYWCLMEKASDYLTMHEYTMFHGVAFQFHAGAYILTAPSGTGKSTQFRNLRTLYGDECQIINGDKPILGYSPDGGILVYPSPWNGKEGWGGHRYAPLRAVILLEQGQTNQISRMDNREAVEPIIKQFIYLAPNRQSVHTVFRMADTMLGSVPCYQFTNRGDLPSSSMLFDLISGIEKRCQ